MLGERGRRDVEDRNELHSVLWEGRRSIGRSDGAVISQHGTAAKAI